MRGAASEDLAGRLTRDVATTPRSPCVHAGSDSIAASVTRRCMPRFRGWMFGAVGISPPPPRRGGKAPIPIPSEHLRHLA